MKKYIVAMLIASVCMGTAFGIKPLHVDMHKKHIAAVKAAKATMMKTRAAVMKTVAESRRGQKKLQIIMNRWDRDLKRAKSMVRAAKIDGRELSKVMKAKKMSKAQQKVVIKAEIKRRIWQPILNAYGLVEKVGRQLSGKLKEKATLAAKKPMSVTPQLRRVAARVKELEVQRARAPFIKKGKYSLRIRDVKRKSLLPLQKKMQLWAKANRTLMNESRKVDKIIEKVSKSKGKLARDEWGSMLAAGAKKMRHGITVGTAIGGFEKGIKTLKKTCEKHKLYE